MESIPWNLIFWGVITLIALRILVTQMSTLRDKLKEMLVEHVSDQRKSIAKKNEIARVQKQLRELKNRSDSSASEADGEAPPKKRAA